jgi:plasmid stabilization system protein ParE
MARLRFSPAAERDLDKISSDIAGAAGIQVALAFVARLRQSLDHLAASKARSVAWQVRPRRQIMGISAVRRFL